MELPDDRSSTHAPSTSLRRARITGAVTAGVVGACCAVAVIGLRAANDRGEPEGQNWWLVAWFVTGLAYSLAGVVLVTRPGRRLLGGWLLVVGASSLTVAVAVQYRGYEQSVAGPPRWPALADADTWARPLGAAVLVALVPAALVPAAWRSDRRGVAIWFVAVAATAAVVAANAAGWRRIDVAASWIVGLVGLVWIGALGNHWWHQRRATSDPLAGWLFAGAVVAWLAVVPDGLGVIDWSLAGRDVVWAVLLIATVPLLVVGALIDELRRAPSDAEQLSHRSLEWALLAAGIVAIYTVVVAGLGRLVGGSGPTWLLVAATGAIALAIEPARQRIRHLVDRLVFGSRDDALAVVQRIVDHVGTDTGDDLLPALARSLERGLRFDAIAIDVAMPGGGWERAASVGPDTEHRHEVVLRHRDEVVGRLVVGWEHAPSMRAHDEQLLDQLAGPLGLAVSWVRLAADLRRSRLAAVSAREARPCASSTAPPSQGRPTRRPPCSPASPRRSTASCKRSSRSCATCARPRSISWASSVRCRSSPACSRTTWRSTSRCRPPLRNSRPRSRSRSTGSSPRRSPTWCATPTPNAAGSASWPTTWSRSMSSTTASASTSRGPTAWA
jgi:hypothetical protein